MCLDLKRFAIRRKASKDITVYKFLEVESTDWALIHYTTPYKHVPILIGETYTSRLKKDGGFFEKAHIHEGLHSFKHKSDAQYYASLFFDHVVAECIIPAGSTYYIGEFGGISSYASDKLKYIKIIEDEDNK